MLFTYGGSVEQSQILHYAAMRNLPDGVEVPKYIYNKDSDTQGTKVNESLDQDTGGVCHELSGGTRNPTLLRRFFFLSL